MKKKNGMPNMKWVNFVNEHRDKLTIRNCEDELLSLESFEAGYKQAAADAVKWLEEYLSKSESCEMEGYGSDDDAVVNFFKDMEE